MKTVKQTNKRITINQDMIDQIHFHKDSGGAERFVLTIDVDTMQEIIQLRQQILKENKEYPMIVEIKERLEHTIKENQESQKVTKTKLDEMDDNQMKDDNYEIDVTAYNTLEDILDELAITEHELESILNNAEN